MNKSSENLIKYIETTDNRKLIRKHAINSKVLVEHYSLYDQLHVNRVFNYSLCDTTNKFTITKTEAYTNDRSKKIHKFSDGKCLKCTFISDYKFYKWLGDNKAIILTTNNDNMITNTLDSEIVSLVKIIRKSRIKEKNLKTICNIYNQISTSPIKYVTTSLPKDESNITITRQNYTEIAYSLLEKDNQFKNLKFLLCEKNALIRVNCQSSIVISNDSSILAGIEKMQNTTCLDIFLQIINTHI